MENLYNLITERQVRTTATPEGRFEKLRITAADSSELDRRIEAEQLRGWLLLCRSHSMDDGHGATLIRKAMDEAA